MIKLIKNEFIKLFHKKAIYILMILTILLIGFEAFMTNINRKFNVSDEDYYQDSVNQLIQGDVSDSDEIQFLLDDKYYYDLSQLAKEFDQGRNSWQYVYLEDKVSGYITCMNENKYLYKNTKKYEECQKSYDKELNYVKENSWQTILKDEKAAYEKDKKELESTFESLPKGEEKNEVAKEIKILEYRLAGLDYSLNDNIEPNTSKKAKLVTNFVNQAIAYLDYNEDESTYKDRILLDEKRSVEKEYKEAKYKLDHKIYGTDNEISLIEMINYSITEPIFLVIIAVIMIAGSIMADEYNKGTIKQLLLRPCTRGQILLSKFITAVIVSIMFLLFYIASEIIIYGFITGYKELSLPIVMYDFTLKKVVLISIWKYIGLYSLALLPFYLILLSVAFLLGSVVGSSIVAFIVAFVTYFFGSIASNLVTVTNVASLKFLPMMNWDLSVYLFGGLPAFKYCNFKIALVVDIMTVLILLGLSLFLFKRKNITNQ